MATRETTLKLSVADNFSTQLRAFARALDQSDQQVNKLSASQKFLKSASQGASDMLMGMGVSLPTSPMMALGQAISFVTSAAMESEKVTFATEAVIKSTGAAAGYTADQIGAMAGKFSELSGVDDEVIQSAENVMLTFTNIGHDVFPQAMQAAQDMSAALGTDLQSAVLMVGKALQDPEKGLTALRRAGVNVNDEMKETVKQFLAMGDAAGAQKYILKELNTEFGGMSEALGNTLEGRINKAKNAIENLGEVIGSKLIPVLGDAADGLTQMLELSNDASSQEEKYRQAIIALTIRYGANSEAVKQVSEQLRQYLIMQKELGMTDSEKQIRANMAAFRDLGNSVKDTSQEYETLKDRMDASTHIMSPLELGMQALAEANYEGSDASKAWNEALKDHKDVMEKATEADKKALEAAGELTIKNYDMLLSFKDFDAVKGAKQTIADLEAAIKADPESRDKYAAQIRSISHEMGFTTVAMEEAQRSFGALEEAWKSGGISTDSYAKALGLIQKAAADGKVSVDELGLKTGEAAAYMAESATTAKGAQDQIVNDAQSAKERMLSEMDENLAGQHTKLGQHISDTMLSISNSVSTTRSLTSMTFKEANELFDSFEKRPDIVKTITFNIVTNGSPPSAAGGHATGADFIVPPGYANDSYPMRVQSGERVTVTPASQVTNKNTNIGGATVHITNNITATPGMDVNALADQVSQKITRKLRALKSSVALAGA